MPFTGPFTPGERYGAGEGNSDAPLLQRVFESIAAQRGDAYDQTTLSKVGAENMAYARAVTFDGWGTNQRLANGFDPQRMTLASGMLPRWERIFGINPLPTDSEVVRRARIIAAWAKIGQTNAVQAVTDALSAALGPVFVGVNHQTYATGLSIVNGVQIVQSAGTTPPVVTLSGTPTDNFIIQMAITTGGARGTALFKWSINNGGSFVATGVSTAATVALTSGIIVTGLTANFSAGTYATDNVYTALTSPGTPWTSTIAHLAVQLTQTVTGYHNTDGSPNAAFYQEAAAVAPILDQMLPAWSTFSWYVNSSHSAREFRLDERDLDLEAFG